MRALLPVALRCALGCALRCALPLGVLGGAGAALAPPLAAQTAAPHPLTHAAVPASSPTAATPLTRGFSFASLSAGATEDDKRAEIQTTYALGGLTLVASASAPLSTSGTTQLGGLDGLSTGTAVSLSLSRIRWRFGGVEGARRSCRQSMEARSLRDREGDLIVPGDSFEVAGVLVAPSDVCGTVGRDFRFDLLRVDQYRRLTSVIQQAEGRPFLYDLNVKVAREGATFLDTTTFTPQEEARTPFSFGASVGMMRSGVLIGAGIAYESAYRAADEVEICAPIGESGALQCRTGPLGAPTPREGGTLSAQLRTYLGRRIGINPQVRYHFTADAWSAEVPVYFAADDDGGLVGALVPGYSSEDDDWSLRLVIGAAFGL